MLCVHICVSVYTCVYKYLCLHVHTSTPCLRLSSVTPSLIRETGSLTELELTVLAGLVASKTWVLSCLCLPRTGIAGMCWHAQMFTVGADERGPGPHACAASRLLPQP